jgi:hypothetical protein
METILSLIGAISFIMWLTGYFGYNGVPNVHVLLLLAIAIFMVKTLMHFPQKSKG